MHVVFVLQHVHDWRIYHFNLVVTHGCISLAGFFGTILVTAYLFVPV